MSLLLIAGIVFVVLLVLLLGAVVCLGAADGDDRAREAFQRERQERKARSDLYGNGGWRG
jgi:hypothetical protein